MFFYFEFKTWLKMLRLINAEKDSKKRRKLLKLVGVKVPLRAIGHTICFFLDMILFPRLWRVNVKEPVFIIGHARSGTTLAHRLMCEDERFSAFRYYELLLPSLLQKKVVGMVAWMDKNWFGQRLEKRLLAWEKRKFGATQHIHKMGLTIPEEDDLMYMSSCASGFWATKLPYMDSLDFFHIDERPEKERKKMMRFYRNCVRRQLYINGDNKIHLSKNPTYCGRVGALIEAFPDARFVLLYRNPYETIPSLLKLLHVSWKMQANTPENIKKSTRTMIDLSYESYLNPLKVLKQHPQIRYAIIDYKKLISAPKDSMVAVYKDLDLPISKTFDAFLYEQQAKSRKHESSHTYSMAEFGLSDEEIHSNLAPLFTQFNWQVKQPENDKREANNV